MNESEDGEKQPRRGDRVRWSREEREQLLSEYQASGRRPEEFARQAGVKVGTLRTWLYKQRAGTGAWRAHFAPVRIVGGTGAPKTGGAITVRWPQGIEMEIPVALDSAGAVRLVRELLGPCLR